MSPAITIGVILFLLLGTINNTVSLPDDTPTAQVVVYYLWGEVFLLLFFFGISTLIKLGLNKAFSSPRELPWDAFFRIMLFLYIALRINGHFEIERTDLIVPIGFCATAMGIMYRLNRDKENKIFDWNDLIVGVGSYSSAAVLIATQSIIY